MHRDLLRHARGARRFQHVQIDCLSRSISSLQPIYPQAHLHLSIPRREPDDDVIPRSCIEALGSARTRGLRRFRA